MYVLMAACYQYATSCDHRAELHVAHQILVKIDTIRCRLDEHGFHPRRMAWSSAYRGYFCTARALPAQVISYLRTCTNLISRVPPDVPGFMGSVMSSMQQVQCKRYPPPIHWWSYGFGKYIFPWPPVFDAKSLTLQRHIRDMLGPYVVRFRSLHRGRLHLDKG